jgi:hypothetical protein
MEEMRFHSQLSPRNDRTPNPLVSPPRNGSRLPQQMPMHDPRANLPRRFTTDSGRVPTLATIASPQRLPEPSQDYHANYQIKLLEKKKLEFERIKEQRRIFELEMRALDQQQRKEALELAQMEEDIGRFGGHQSEPTTPPEYRDNSGFPSMFSRPNRYSMSSLTSPPGFLNRPARSGSQLTSPPSGMVPNRFGFEEHSLPSQLPSRSVPTTRRNSDDEEKEEAIRQDPTSHRSGNALNRYSMPVTRSRNGLYDINLDQTNTTRFLFGDDEPNALHRGTTPDVNFPTLVRREDQMLSASSTALDLALSASPLPETTPTNGWSNINRHRPQQSLSAISLSSPQASDVGSIGSRPASLRQSLDLKYIAENGIETPNVLSPQGNHMMATPPKLQSSYSSNDVPTVKSPTGSSGLNGNANNHAQQHFHNHNASIGRIPAGAVPTRHTRELSSDNTMGANREQASTYQSLQSALQASAAPFGPSTNAVAPMGSGAVTSPTASNPANSFNGFYPSNGYASPPATSGPGQYNMPLLTAGMQQMNVNNVSNGSMYPPQNYTGYGSLPYGQGNNQPRDSQARVMQHRRQLDNEGESCAVLFSSASFLLLAHHTNMIHL